MNGPTEEINDTRKLAASYEGSGSSFEAAPGKDISLFISKAGVDFFNSQQAAERRELYIFTGPVFPVKGVKRKPDCDNRAGSVPLSMVYRPAGPKNSRDIHIMTLLIGERLLREMSLDIHDRKEMYLKNDGVKLSNDMQSLVRQYVDESAGCLAGYKYVADSLAVQIAVGVLRQVKENIAGAGPGYGETMNIKRVTDYFIENYNAEYSLPDTARIANLSPYHFIRVFKAQTGKTPYNYLLEIRIGKAMEMLKASRFSITEICYACGFNNLSHFNMVFKRKTGIPPSVYRKGI